MTLDYGNYGMFLIIGNAGFISLTVVKIQISCIFLLCCYGRSYFDANTTMTHQDYCHHCLSVLPAAQPLLSLLRGSADTFEVAFIRGCTLRNTVDKPYPLTPAYPGLPSIRERRGASGMDSIATTLSLVVGSLGSITTCFFTLNPLNPT